MNYLSEYQSFQSKQQMNEAIADHLAEHYYELNATVREVLNVVSRHAVKFPGVAHLKASTIAEIIDKSEKTVRRALNKLQELGVVKKIATMRKVTGGKGANIIVVQSSVSSRQLNETPTESKVEPVKNETEPFISLSNKRITYKDTAIPSQALKDSLPSEIYNAMSRYFKADDIYKYYGVLLRAKKSISNDVMIEDNPEPFVNAWHNVILKAKQGKLQNMANYLYRAWQAATTKIVNEQRPVNIRLVPKYDWLNEKPAPAKPDYDWLNA